MKDLIRWLHSVFGDLHYEVEDLVAEHDKVVVRTRLPLESCGWAPWPGGALLLLSSG